MLTRSVLRAWWCADDWTNPLLVTDDGSGLISSWADRIGGIAATGSTTARPTAAADSFNSLPGVTFDRSANALLTTALTNLPGTTTPGTVWAVGKVTTAAAGATQSLIAYGAGSSFRQVRVGSTGIPSFNDNAGVSIALSALADAESFILSGAFDASSITGYLNGTALPTGANTLNTTMTRLRLGAGVGASATLLFGGVLRHVFVTTALTTLQRQQLEGWAAWDSGLEALLPGDHPYRGSPP